MRIRSCKHTAMLSSVAAAALCGAMVSTTAFAQDSNADSDTAEEEVLDDDIIIVTATRRAEDVRTIPLAVTAVTPIQLERQNVVSVTALGQLSPSFSSSAAQVASGTIVLRIRGVGTTSNNIGFESAVGIFVDGVYQSRPGIALSEMVDVERIEVLRGPQGTLFGRNTSAGALNITNKRPDVSETSGFANASYGSHNLVSVQGAVNVPLIQDQLAARVTGAYRNRQGYITILNRDGDEIGRSNEIDQYLLRFQLGWEGDSGAKVRFIGDYSKSNANCCSAIELLRSASETNGFFERVGRGARGGMAAPNVATSANDNAGLNRALNDRIATANKVPEADASQWGVTLEAEIPLSDDVSLFYIGSYRDYRSDEDYDSDFSGLDIFNVPSVDLNVDTMTHELRFQGEAWDGRLSWLIGGYYSKEDIAQSVGFALGTDYDANVAAIFLQGNPLAPGAPASAPFAVLTRGGDISTVRATNAYTQNSQSWSLFTHNTLEIVDGLKLTGGLRWSSESKDGSFTQPENINPICAPLATAVAQGAFPAAQVPLVIGLGCFAFTAPADLPLAAALPLPRSFSDTYKDDELIWTVKLGYEFDAPINIYASFTHGYKAGGFNLDSTAAVGGADPRFRSETVDSYEVGLKGKFLDNAVTINIAAFHQEFTDFQVLEFTGTQFQTFNVPKALSTGVEFESVLRPIEGLTANLAVTYTNARYPDDCATAADPLRVQNLCGHLLTNAPNWVGIVGLTYAREIANDMEFFFNAQARMESDRRTSTQARSTSGLTAANVGTTPLLAFDVQDGNTKINLRAGLGRVGGLWAIEGWVTNVTNVTTRGVTFNTTLRGDSRSAFLQEPRMFGVTVRTKF